jgi:L-alanine-DL-glutamate epimerase-like enolase superfamily enzyme
MSGRSRPEVRIDDVHVGAYTVPTDAPESDGTLAWDATTLVLVEVHGGGRCGIGFTYAAPAAARLVSDVLADAVSGGDAMEPGAAWEAMVRSIRNQGRPGISSMAISAVDVALWDLKARLLDLPLVDLLGATRDAVPVYGSGGFTSYPLDRLEDQLADWVSAGIPRVKMKVGRHPAQDEGRVMAARGAIGPDTALYVDANGAWDRKQALDFAGRFVRSGVTWLEEPVPSEDLPGLRLIRDRAPDGVEVAAGEYGYDAPYFRRMLEHGAVDVMQADLTRCGGITGLLDVAALCRAFGTPLSTHCAPALHLHPACAASGIRHAEYFHDHVRIEEMLFDGVVRPLKGSLSPDRSRPGHGLEFRRADARRFAV